MKNEKGEKEKEKKKKKSNITGKTKNLHVPVTLQVHTETVSRLSDIFLVFLCYV